MDTDDNTTKDHNAAIEDTSDDEETKVAIRTRPIIAKPKAVHKSAKQGEQSQKFTLKPEKVREMLASDAESPITPSNHHKRHTHRKFLEMQHQLYKLQQSLKSNEEIDMKVNRPKRDGQKLDGGTHLFILQLLIRDISFVKCLK